MLGAVPVLHALGGPPTRLLVPGALLPAMGFVRASAALLLGADGTSWQPLGPDLPRFPGPARRLLAEGARTNGNRNPRAEGAVPGTPGTAPTGWSIAAGGFARQVVGTGVEGGIPYLELRLSGTNPAAAADDSIQIRPDGATAVAAATGQAWTASAFLRVVAGSLAGLQILQHLAPAGTGGTPLGTLGGPLAPPDSSPLGGQRRSVTQTLGAAGTAYVQQLLTVSVAAGAAFDVTLRIGAPQLELGGSASSPILPPAGLVAASTRAAETASLPLPAAQAQRGTVIGSFLLPQAAPPSTAPPIAQGLFVLHDGTDANRIALRNTAGGTAVTAIKVVGGTVTNIGTLGAMTPGVPFRAALAWDPAGTTVCMTGGTPVRVDGAVPPVSRLLAGHNQTDLAAAAFGEAATLDLHAHRMPDAGLQALTNP